MEKFSYRSGNLEVRSVGNHLLLDGEHNTAEIIEWFNNGNESCYALAYWERGKEDFYLKFVGNRAFQKTVSPLTFMKLAELGQEELDIFFNILEDSQ